MATSLRSTRGLCTLSTLLIVLGCDRSVPPPGSQSFPEVKQEASLIIVTPKAAATIKRVQDEEEPGQTMYLRLRVTPGGCQGYQHKLDLVTDISPKTDLVFESNGVKVVLEKRQREMLQGSRIDYGVKDDQEGFMVENPNFEGEGAIKWLSELNPQLEDLKIAPNKSRQ